MAAIAPRTIQLEPVQHAAPACADFADLQAVRAFERDMRIHRAHTERFAVAPLDGKVDGAWRVCGAKGAAYVVDIVDGSGQHDACTCPDFLEGELGTCKHLEAVRRAIQSRAGLQRAFRRLGPAPACPTLVLDPCGGPAIRGLGGWNLRAFGPCALAAAGGRTGLTPASRVLQPGVAESLGVRVVHAVLPAVVRHAARARNRQRTGQFLQALQDGDVGVDVLREPLFPYQTEGVAHLAAAGRAVLADDMGLGKTVQAIAACEVLRARGEAETVLIVAPASLKHQWAQEIERYSGRRAVVLGGAVANRTAALASSAPYKILSYELTWRELHRLKDLEADILILDEAQRAKNFRTRTAATLKAIPSRFLFVLTGTPIENRLDDLYSLLQLVDPGILGPLWRFNLDFHKQGRLGKVVGCKNLGRLRETIAPVLLRRRKEAVLNQLPDLTQQTRYTPLSQEQADYEAACRAEAARYLAIAEKRPLTPREQKALQTALLKARQACDALELADPGCPHPASPKLDEFEDCVAEIAAQGTSKVLVFSEWVEMLKLAAARLDRQGIGWTMLTGGVPVEQRPALLDRFRSDPAIQVLLSSDAGGVGLNLQVANYVVHLDLPWNPARLDQRTSRAHRLGQTRGVTVTCLCSEGGIERGIEGTLAGKRAVRSAALDPASPVEELEVQGFSVFLRQLRETLEQSAGAADRAQEGMEEEPAPAPAAEGSGPVEPGPAEGRMGLVGPSPAPAGDGRAAAVRDRQPVAALADGAEPGLRGSPRCGGRAQDRLRLAQVVLAAGFPGDAVRAGYESLAAAVASLLDKPPAGGHENLVAAIYRDLIPAGRLPLAVPGVLARINDLAALERLGVEVDPGLAEGALREVREWVGRLVQAQAGAETAAAALVSGSL